MAADELLAMSNDHEFISLDGMRPIYAEKIRYYKNSTYQKRARMCPGAVVRTDIEKKLSNVVKQVDENVVESKNSINMNVSKKEDDGSDNMGLG